MFRDPKGFPLKRGMEHEIQLLLDSPLPNIGLYRQYIVEIVEVRKCLQQLLEKGVIQTSTQEGWDLVNVYQLYIFEQGHPQ